MRESETELYEREIGGEKSRVEYREPGDRELEGQRMTKK